MPAKSDKGGWRLFCDEEPPNDTFINVYVEDEADGYWMPECK